MRLTDNKLDLSVLVPLFEEVNRLERALYALPEHKFSGVVTPRKFDCAQPAGHRVYMEAERYLEAAIDNLTALRQLLGHGAGLFAPWSLLRSVFEASVLAAWILDPEDGSERRYRGLRSEIWDAVEELKYLQTLVNLGDMSERVQGLADRRRKQRIDTYQDELAQMGRDWEKARQSVSVIDAIPRLSFVRNQGDLGVFIQSTWRLLSGYQHGKGWAVVHGSSKTAVAQVVGGVSVQIELDGETFVTAAKATLLVLVKAMNKLLLLSQEPSA